jgi:hypothetical protein
VFPVTEQCVIDTSMGREVRQPVTP